MADRQLYTRANPEWSFWVVSEDDPQSNAESVMAEQVTSEPPDNHLWKVIPGTRQLMARSEIEASHKHIELS